MQDFTQGSVRVGLFIDWENIYPIERQVNTELKALGGIRIQERDMEIIRVIISFFNSERLFASETALFQQKEAASDGSHNGDYN